MGGWRRGKRRGEKEGGRLDREREREREPKGRRGVCAARAPLFSVMSDEIIIIIIINISNTGNNKIILRNE